jgi:hypothetical protein
MAATGAVTISLDAPFSRAMFGLTPRPHALNLGLRDQALRWECSMRKLLLALATCGIIAAAASQPAEARVFIGFGFGPSYGYYPHHHFYGNHCYFKNVRVKVWRPKLHKYVWVWKTRRFCW